MRLTRRTLLRAVLLATLCLATGCVLLLHANDRVGTPSLLLDAGTTTTVVSGQRSPASRREGELQIGDACPGKYLPAGCRMYPGPQRPQCCCLVPVRTRSSGLSKASSRKLSTVCLPSFVVVGAQKSGSTALFSFFLFHPMFRPPRSKELHIFDRRLTGPTAQPQISRSFVPAEEDVLRMQHYLAMFTPVSAEEGRAPVTATSITGETTPAYILVRSTCGC